MEEEGAEAEGEQEPSFVQAKLTLELDMDEVAKDPEAKAAFEAQFVADMATTLGCDPSQLPKSAPTLGGTLVGLYAAIPSLSSPEVGV